MVKDAMVAMIIDGLVVWLWVVDGLETQWLFVDVA